MCVYIGFGSMHRLWVEFNNHNNLKHIVNDFYDQELSLRIEMGILPVGGTSWCMCEMKRHLLFDQCKKECKEHFYKAPTHSDRCPRCDIIYFIDNVTSSKICKSCGQSITILLDDKHDYSTRDRYNGNRRHHYNPTEHFSQTICDFTCTGSRKVPVDVFAYCRSVLGRGLHVTSQNVFLTLQMGGYSKYYLCKYEITNRLRGSPEFTVTSREITALRDVYTRYRSEFIPFQQAHYIGTCSRNGKPRIYWPMRYILKRMCDEIGRSDLNLFIRGVCDTKKNKLYDKYWYKLKHFIDSTRPKRSRIDPSCVAVPLRPRS